MNILEYIPYTPQNRRRKLLRELTMLRHYEDDILSADEKSSFDRIISDWRNAPLGREPEKTAERSVARLGKRNVIGDWLDLFLVVGAVAFGLRALYFQPFRIPTGSMQPTLYGVHYVDKQHEGSPLLGKNKLTDALLYAAKSVEAKAPESGYITPDSFQYDSFGIFGKTSFDISGSRCTLAGDPVKVIDFFGLDPQKNYQRGQTLGSGAIMLGDHLFVERFSIYLTPLKRGDIIIFTTEDLIDENSTPVIDSGYFYIKRLAALPGDTIKIVDDQLYVKPAGEKYFSRIQDISEPFKKVYSGKGGYHGHVSCMGTGAFADGSEYTVPAGHYFMLGDNSRFSKDSRFFGAVPRRNIMGRAFLVFWPFSRRAGIADCCRPVDEVTGKHGLGTFYIMSKQ